MYLYICTVQKKGDDITLIRRHLILLLYYIQVTTSWSYIATQDGVCLHQPPPNYIQQSTAVTTSWSYIVTQYGVRLHQPPPYYIVEYCCYHQLQLHSDLGRGLHQPPPNYKCNRIYSRALLLPLARAMYIVSWVGGVGVCISPPLTI